MPTGAAALPENYGSCLYLRTDYALRQDVLGTETGLISSGSILREADGAGDVTVQFQQGTTTKFVMGIDD